MKWGGIKATLPTPNIPSGCSCCLKVQTTHQPDVRGRAPWGVGAGWWAGSTCSNWSPVFETGSLRTLQAPCNPSASVFPLQRGKLAGDSGCSIGICKLLWRYKGQDRREEERTIMRRLCQHKCDKSCKNSSDVAPAWCFLPEGESGWWGWWAGVGWARNSNTNVCKWAA